MGMLDKKLYLTGREGVLTTGDKFTLHGVKFTGMVTVDGQQRKEVALKLTPEGNSESVVVYTTGSAIVAQCERIDDNDKRAMRDGGLPMKLVQRGGGGQRNPAYVLASQDAPDTAEEDASAVGDGFDGGTAGDF